MILFFFLFLIKVCSICSTKFNFFQINHWDVQNIWYTLNTFVRDEKINFKFFLVSAYWLRYIFVSQLTTWRCFCKLQRLRSFFTFVIGKRIFLKEVVKKERKDFDPNGKFGDFENLFYFSWHLLSDIMIVIYLLLIAIY